jgi:aspartate aminotransferase
MPASPIRKLVPFADEAKKRGINVHHLNIGQPDIETPPAALDAVKNTPISVLAYSHSAGNLSYREKLVHYYAKNNIAVEAGNIMITAGGSEAIVFAFMACLDPGDEIIIPEPFYANYNGFAVMAGVTVIPVTSSIEKAFELPPVDQFEAVITTKTKAILICNPNNPTGYVYSREELEKLEDICLRHNLFLFSDEAYREFSYGAPCYSAMQLKKIPEQVILMDTISKRYAACGARIGALITKNKSVLEAVMKLAQARLSPPSFAQIAAEAAIDLPSDYFQETQEEYRSRRDLLVARLNAIPGVFCPNPGGAFYAIARLPINDSDQFCQWLLEDFAFEGKTIMLAPATGFYGTPGLGKDEVRLAYVLNKTDINTAMDCLEKALAIYPWKTSH